MAVHSYWRRCLGPCFVFLVFASLGAAQSTLFGPQQVISTSGNAPVSVFAADLDGDGDLDILSATERDDKISWYENLDGMGAFGPQQVITKSADGAESVFAADLDGDGDLDVLSASARDDKISWYENTDGTGTFGPQLNIITSADSALDVFAADIDGDGDQDVLSASRFDDKIAWYENTDGLGGFGPQQVITTSAVAAHTVYTADLDGDGDQDVLSASQTDDKIAWYENRDGLGDFGAQRVITTSADGAFSVIAADMDGDGDQDVLSASFFDDKIAWYENTDGKGAFGPQLVITTSAEGAESVFAADLDGDGDQDVISSSFADDKIAWYENTDGMGTFGPQRVITTSARGARWAVAADLDGDGDMDILSASAIDDKIAWYENLGAPVPEIEVVPTSIGHGNQDVGAGVTVGAAVTIANVGTAALGFIGAQVALTGPDAAEFTIISDTGEGSLPPSASRTVTVAFDPATLGAKSANLTITTDDADEATVNVALTGFGAAAPEIDLADGATSIPDGGGPVDFGVEDQGGPLLTKTFTVSNAGSLALTTGSPELPTGYSVTEPLALSITAGASDSFTVALSTAAPGVFAGTIRFGNNDPDENPFDFTVTGTILGFPEVGVLSGTILVRDGSGPFNVGTALLGGPALERTFKVINTGTRDLTTSNLSVPPGYTVVDPLDATIPQGLSDEFTIQLATGTLGVFAGTISFDNSDADENPYNFLITAAISEAIPMVPTLSQWGIFIVALLMLVAGSRLAGGSGSIRG